MNFFHFKNFYSQSIKLVLTTLLGLVIFTLFRVIYLIMFGLDVICFDNAPSIILALLNGIRYDTMVILYTLLPIFIINIVTFLNKKSVGNIVNKVSFYFVNIILFFHILFLIVDQQFYTYFQSHINIMIFGFIEDDTTAVIRSMWTDHPVFIIILSITLLTYIQIRVLKKIYKKTYVQPSYNKTLFNIAFFILIFGSYALGMRGSVGVFPLQIDNATVGDNQFINTLSLNGQYTFKLAVVDRKKQGNIVTPERLLHNRGYKNINEVISDYYGCDKAATDSNYLDFLYLKTKKDTFLQNNPPNVVFILMESFGYYYLKIHDKEHLNLLGSLEKNIEKDLLFTNFVSSTRGTIYSFEEIMINNSGSIISNSILRFNSFKSSVAYPFKSKGYETIFISGGKVGWRNLFEWVPNQYFSQTYGVHSIVQRNSKAKTNTWGVFDEYLFDDIYSQLSTGNKPKMIWALSTSNHTPYELPSNYKALPLEITDSLNSVFIADEVTARKNLTAYQYSNEKVGQLIDRIKKSELGENTIIALTGDHNSYALFPYNTTKIEEKYRYTVPFYLYIPEKYKKHIDYKAVQKRTGSHKDIFPTLFNLALSDQEYCNLGNNLLSESKADSLFYGINRAFTMYPSNSNIDNINKRVKAHNTLSIYNILKTALEQKKR